MSVSSQPQRSQKSSGRWTASLMGLPSPEAPTIQTMLAVPEGITGSQAAWALSGSRLLPSASAQDVVKALCQLAEWLGGGGELACLRVQDACLTDASARKARAGLAGATRDMCGARLPRRGVQATVRPVPWHAGDGKHMRGGAEEHAAASAHELKTQRL